MDSAPGVKFREGATMKRIKMRPGKFVRVSEEAAQRAAQAFQSVAYSREKAQRIASAEPRGVTVYAGRVEPGRRATLRAFQTPEKGDSLIIEDPNVMRGSPVFYGTRVPISMVLASLKAGSELFQLQEAYPFLTQQLVDAALMYVQVNQAAGAPAASDRPARRLVSSETVLLSPRRK